MALRVWLPLNGTLENKGISDVTVTNNGATVDNNGKIGKCYYFNRSIPNYLKIDNPFQLSSINKFSMAFWIKIPSNASGNNQIIHIGNGAGWNNNRFTCFIYQSSSSLVFSCGDGTDSSATHSTQYSCKSSSLVLNEWIHVACTYSTGVMKLYLNGVLNVEYTTSIIPSFANVPYIGIGAGPNAGEPATIYVNDARIYDHCLSAKEVKEISQGLVLHYKLDGWSGGSGENLAYGTNTADISTNIWRLSNQTGGTTNSIEYDGNTPVAVITRDDVAQSGWSYLHYDNIHPADIKPSTTYTISFDVMTSVDGTIGISALMQGNATNSKSKSVTNIRNICTAGTWSHIILQTVTKDDFTDINNSQVIYLNTSSSLRAVNVTIKMKNMKMEIGSKDTPWSPALTEIGIDTTKVTDSSGYGNDGTILSNPYINSDTSRYQISTYFDGVDDGILIENLTLSSIINDQVSYSFWIKPQGENGARSVYFGSYSSTSWSVEKTAGNILRLYWNGSPDETCSGATITDGIWQHIVITKNGANNIKVYINGAQKWTSTAAHNTLSFPTTYRIGRDTRTGDGTPYHGLMSDFRIYATALSAEDILDLYHTPANIDNLSGLHGFEFIDNINNRIMEANGTIATKNWNNSTLLKNYQQTNCQVTLTDDGLRIYRPPNYNPTDNGNTMWGGMRINNTRDGSHPIYGSGDNPIGLEKGHTYIIAFHVKGKSSNATNNYGWSNQMGWGGGGLGPTPTDVSYDLLPSNFNGEKECWYKWTINDDIVKTCTTSYSYAVAGNQYMSYADFAFGWQYQDTGALGSDVYITNLRLYDITNLDMSNIQKNGIINFTQLDELAQTNKASITFYKELQASNFIEK